LSLGVCKYDPLGATTVFLLAFGFLASRLLRCSPLAMISRSSLDVSAGYTISPHTVLVSQTVYFARSKAFIRPGT
jgi:hypothetical protein